MIVVTGATGQLGRLVIAALRERGVAAGNIVAAVRNPQKAADLAAQGIVVRRADYAEPASLNSAFEGAQRVLLISGNEVGQRVAQHQAVVDAAVRAGVAMLAYTSLLHATSTPLGLAVEHRATEAALAAVTATVPSVILRNGWYNENFETRITGGVAGGVIYGAAADGVFAPASRADYAAAAAAVLTDDVAPGVRILELAGSNGFTLSALAAKVAAKSGKPVRYENVSQSDFQAGLEAHGLPTPFAALIADSDAGAATGALFDDSDTLAGLIGRPTTPIDTTIAALV